MGLLTGSSEYILKYFVGNFRINLLPFMVQIKGRILIDHLGNLEFS
jgi:hypothetical protein